MKEIVLYTTDYDFEEMKKEYVTWSSDNGIEVSLEDVTDSEVWDYVSDRLEMDYDDFKLNYKKFFEDGVLLMGTLGRWNGNKQAIKYCEDIDDFRSSLSSFEYIKIYKEGKHTYVSCADHDGSSIFEVRLMNNKGFNMWNRLGFEEEIILDNYDNWKKYYTKCLDLHL